MKEEREKLLRKEISQVRKDASQLKEKIKILEKRLDFSQDETARLAVYQQSIVQSVTFMVEIGMKIAEKEKVAIEMGLKKGPPVTTPGKDPPQEGLYG